MCIILLISTSACKRNNTSFDSQTSSAIYSNESIIIVDSQVNESINGTENINSISTSSNEETSQLEVTSNVSSESSKVETQDNKVDSYDDIVCTAIYKFKQVGFSVSGSNTMLFVKLPQDWILEKSTNGYNILNASKVIGSITTSVSNNNTVNVFNNKLTVNDIDITHDIEQITANEEPSYIRVLSYKYTNDEGNTDSVIITVPYQEIDSSAAYKMITETTKSSYSTKSNLGILMPDNARKSILILGNSFIGSSRIGNILQTMCGNDVYVEAHARGYAHVGTYTSDTELMQYIKNGSYAAVLICGLYDQEAVTDLEYMISACKESNTKLAIFPAHNENQQKIDHAVSLYPDTILLDWKAEINHLISTGIDTSNFCINDSHKHSTPLAGYVGAHMIYRAFFNEIPKTTQFDDVTQEQLNLLGDYITTGTVILLNKDNVYALD